MAAFASAAELASYLQISEVDTYTAELQLDIASGKIRRYCGWSISEVVDDTATLAGGGGSVLFLPSLHVTAVSSVVGGGVTLTSTDYTWDESGALRLVGSPAWDYSDQAVYSRGLGYEPYAWPTAARSVTVTFTHGYATVPDEVKGECLKIAALGYTAQVAKTETMGGYTVGYDAPDMAALDGYRLLALA